MFRKLPGFVCLRKYFTCRIFIALKFLGKIKLKQSVCYWEFWEKEDNFMVILSVAHPCHWNNLAPSNLWHPSIQGIDGWQVGGWKGRQLGLHFCTVLVWIWEQWRYTASTGPEESEDTKTMAFQTDLSIHMQCDTC